MTTIHADRLATRPVGAGTPSGRTAVDRWAPLALVVLVALAFVPYLVQPPGFVLDDWYWLRNAHFDGALGAAGTDQGQARPGAWLVYAFVFGVIGRHPSALLALLAIIEALTAVLLFRLVRRWFGPGLAAATAALWVVLPNHTSGEVWASAANISLAGLLVVGGLILVGDPTSRGRRLSGLVLLALSVLCYQATLPLVAVGIVVVRARAHGSFDRSFTAAGAVALGAPFLWMLTHWDPAKQVATATSDVSQALPAHVGWGIVPEGRWSTITLIAALAGITAIVVVVSRRPPPRHWSPQEAAVITGVVVIALSTLPFLRYPYAPLGAGDRANFLSSMGGALLWAGLLAAAFRWRAVTTVAVVVVLGLAATERWERAGLWHRAGQDAAAIIEGVQAHIPDPTDEIVIGPAPIVAGNVAAFVDGSNVRGALQLAYDDRSVQARMSYTQADFEAVPPARRFDLRTVSRLDQAE